MKRTLTVALLLASGPVTSLAAQRAADGFQRWEYSGRVGADRLAGRSSSRNEPRRDYRYEGLLIGGAGLGVFGAILGHGLNYSCPTVPGGDCNPDRLGRAVTLGLIGAAVGGGLGYLVGRLSPKPPPRGTMDSAGPSDGVQVQRGAVAVPDSIRKKVGYQHWKGGAIGGAIGGLAGLLLSQVGTRDYCTDCTSRDSDVLEITAIGAGLGGAFGFLVGAASPKYEWVPPER